MRKVIGGLVLILESAVMNSMGYGVTTWQWWAMILLTVLYALIIAIFFGLDTCIKGGTL